MYRSKQGGEKMSTVLLISVAIIGYMLIKEKIKNYIFAMWMAEKNYPPPEKKDIDRLAQKVTDRFFKRN